MSNLRSHLTKSDFILILFLLFIGIGITVWIYYPKSTPASTVEVRENGKLILSTPVRKHKTNDSLYRRRKQSIPYSGWRRYYDGCRLW